MSEMERRKRGERLSKGVLRGVDQFCEDLKLKGVVTSGEDTVIAEATIEELGRTTRTGSCPQ